MESNGIFCSYLGSSSIKRILISVKLGGLKTQSFSSYNSQFLMGFWDIPYLWIPMPKLGLLELETLVLAKPAHHWSSNYPPWHRGLRNSCSINCEQVHSTSFIAHHRTILHKFPWKARKTAIWHTLTHSSHCMFWPECGFMMFHLMNKNIHGEAKISPNMPAYTWIPTVLVAEATLASPSRIHRKAPRAAATQTTHWRMITLQRANIISYQTGY